MNIAGLPGLPDLEVVDRRGDTLVLRGHDAQGSQLLVKTHASALPTAAARERLRREHDSTTAARHPHLVAAAGFVDQANRTALLLDDPQGPTLAEAAAGGLPPDELLRAAEEVAGALAALHARGLVHGAVDADHIVLTAGGAVLVDLYDACPVGTRPRRVSHGAHQAPETAAAAAPPAAGAADQYALGATVGVAFRTAGHPVPPELDVVLSRAVNGDPRARYRSVLGFGDELGRVREGRKPLPGDDRELALGWEDPRSLVGRDDVLGQLDEMVASVTDGGVPQVVVVRGPLGSGRTSVLAAFCDRLADQGVLSGLGRFGGSGAAVPLRAPIEVMDQVVSQLLAAPDEVLQEVRDGVVARLGPDLPVAVQVAPSLALLVGEQPAPAEAPPEETVARVERSMRAALGAIATAVPPFVAVFDDIEQADATSLRGLQRLAGHPDTGPLLTVVTTTAERNLADGVLDQLRGRGVRVRDLALEPLRQDDVRQIVADGTGSPVEHVAALADAVWARSGGNPQVALADIWTMVASGDLWVDTDARRWVWTPSAVAHEEPTTVEAVARARLASLPTDLLEAVQAVAVAGRAATHTVLEALTQRSAEEVELLVERGVAVHVLTTTSGRVGEVACLDDGIRRAALEELEHGPVQLRADLDRAVARAVWASLPVRRDGGPGPTDVVRYELIRLLTGSEEVREDADEQDRFVSLCEDAARAAHRAGGFREALEVQQAALAALGARGWNQDHDRTFELHLRAAEHAVMIGQAELADGLLEEAWAHHPSALQRVRAMRILGTRSWTSQDHGRGLDALAETLAELGEPIPTDPSWVDIGKELVATRRALGRTEPEAFLAAPALEDERVGAALDAMLGCVHLAYVGKPALHVLLVLRGTRLTVQHGVTPSSAYFLTAYGMLQLSVPGGIGRGLRFGEVGMQIARRSKGEVATMVVFAHNSFVRHWGAPVEVTIEPMLDEYRSALANGQRGYGLTGGTFAVLHALLASRPLPAVETLAAECSEELDALEEPAFRQRVDVVRQAVADLRSGPSAAILDGPLFSAPGWLAAKPRRGELAVIVHTLRAFVALAHGDLDQARVSVAAAAPLLRSAPGQAVLAVHCFQVAYLDAEAVMASTGTADRARRRAQAERSYRRLRTVAHHAPANAAHRVALVEAVLAEGRSRPGSAGAKAMERYDAAVTLASEHGALHDLGLIAERSAQFHVRMGRLALAQHYASVARDAAHAWGADAVADGISARLPGLVLEQAPAATPQPDAAAPDATGGSAAAAPRPGAEETFAEATRLLGQELEVREFLERLVEILMRHADASRGFLVLESARGPVVEVAATLAGDVVAVTPLPSPDLRDHRQLCTPAVNFVLRTRQVLSLTDPAEDRRLRADPDLRDRAPRALLCLPIGRPRAASGALVLESDTFSHAFESGRVEALRVLSEQAISAIDHARLSSDLSTLSDDVAELRSTAATLTTQAETDPLTGVANRLGLESRLQTAIRAAHAPSARRASGVTDPQVGVLFCDLDGFKEVNDQHGHASGDQVLEAVSGRICSAVRSEDIVARVGGDEFVVVSIGVSDAELRRMADRLLLEIAQPIEVRGVTVAISTSIGIGQADLGHVTTTDDVDALVQVADRAMYQAKDEGKNRVGRA